MKSRGTFVAALLCVVVIAISGGGISVFSRVSAPVRNFEFTYVTKIPPLPGDAKSSRIWIPLPQSDAYQAISDLKIDSSFPYATHRDSEYGNEYVYLEIPTTKLAGAAEVRVHFQAARQEHHVAVEGAPNVTNSEDREAHAGDLKRFLEPDRRVPLAGTIAELSAQETHGIQDPMAKARAIYDYVLATMRYDKSGTGWGNGDAIWACTAKRGNCTDFHSLFIGMMRAAGIPARFEIGFSLPEEQHSAAIAGYHCWAEFYLPRYGWIPVDASEAWKHPEKRNYFFGTHDDNRVQFTVGRDIRLDPAQRGEPLNYFIYPYAEVDGKPLALESKFSFQDRLASSD
ncbi:MAG TPA: transglutaminase domain-containing protein [Candidatus Saccharimonadales bacterium]|nr:transglutaminase domain-containing protein [Candidatus Saccharimonadales bacterium]